MKQFKLLALTALILGLNACQSDEPIVGSGAGKDALVSFSAEIPQGLQSRAFADGTTATKLSYAVYEAGTTNLLLDSRALTSEPEVTFDSDLKATVNINLVTGKTYDIIFWADAFGRAATTSDPYQWQPATRTIEVNYDGALASDETRDAFFFAVKALEVTGDMQQSAVLKRPFAQINVGTNDCAAAGVAGGGSIQAKMELTQAFTTLDLYSGQAKNPTPASVVFDYSNLPLTEEFPIAGYDFLEMNYVLIGNNANEDTFTTDVKLSFKGANFENTVSVPAVPLKPNYRTNIYGSLLTSAVDFDVTIEPGFGGALDKEYVNFYGVAVQLDPTPWDGTTLSTSLVINEAEKVVAIASAADIALLASLVNDASASDFAGYSIELLTDVDLNGHEWTPIADGTRSGSSFTGAVFKGNFDGNGHTVKGLTIADNGGADQARGFFGVVSGGSVSNLKFDDVDINVPANEMAAAAVGMLTDGGVVSNITVTSGTISAKRGVGAIVGRMTKSGSILDCKNYAEINGTAANVGGIVGAAYYTADGQKMVIENCQNHGEVTGTASNVGGITGLSAAFVTNCSNDAVVTGNGACVGGLIGEQQNAGAIVGCSNSADVKNLSTSGAAFGTGGIVGWIRYNGTTSNYASKNIIDVKDCTNSGDVTGGASAGGIVGHVYNYANVLDNTNTATTISANVFAAGIVGSIQQDNNIAGMPGSRSVVVSGNISTTESANISASNKDAIAYNNDSAGEFTTIENNTAPVAMVSMTWKEFCTLNGYNFGSDKAPTTAVVVDGKGTVCITDWVDMWYAGPVTIKNMTFKNGITMSARKIEGGIKGKVVFENYCCPVKPTTT